MSVSSWEKRVHYTYYIYICTQRHLMTSLLLHVDIVQLKDYRWCFPSQFCCSSPHIFSGEWSNLTHKWSNGLVQPATRRVVLEFNKAGYIIYIYLHIIHMCIFLNNYHTMPGAWFMNTVCSFPAFEPWLMQRRKHIPPNACIYIYIYVYFVEIIVYICFVLCPKKKQYLNDLTFQYISGFPVFLSFSFWSWKSFKTPTSL